MRHTRSTRAAMILVSGILIGIATSAGAGALQVRMADAETREAVTAVKHAIVKGHIAKDAEALARLYADDYAAIDSKGTIRTKRDLLADLESDPDLVDARYDIIAVRRWGSVAVATGRGHLVSRRADGSTSTSEYYSFNVFEWRDSRWLYVGAFLP